MPLTQMADHVDGIEQLKAVTGYGLPKQYPLAISGLFGDKMPTPVNRQSPYVYPWAGMVAQSSAPMATQSMKDSILQMRQKLHTINGLGLLGSDFEGLGCGADCPCSSCSKNMHGLGYFGATAPLTEAEQADIELGVVVPRGSGPAQPQLPQSNFAQNVQAVTGSIAAALTQLAPAFKRAPRPKVVVQREAPDNTVTYAVIGGAVIVASVLAIAVGKSGRKKS